MHKASLRFMNRPAIAQAIGAWLMLVAAVCVGGGEPSQPGASVETFFQVSHNWRIAWTEYVRYLLERGEYSLAAIKCDEALKKFPDDKEFTWDILSTKAFALEYAGMYDGAIKCVQLLYEKFKDDQTVMPDGQPRSCGIRISTPAILARIYRAQGRYEDAIIQHRESMAMTTSEVLRRYSPERRGAARFALNVTTPMHVGDCYAELGKHDLALREYEKALEYTKDERNFTYGATKEKNQAVAKQRDYYLTRLSDLIAGRKANPKKMSAPEDPQVRRNGRTAPQVAPRAAARPGCVCGCGGTTATLAAQTGTSATAAGACCTTGCVTTAVAAGK